VILKRSLDNRYEMINNHSVMRRPKSFLFRTLSLVVTVSFAHLLLSVAVVPDTIARMGPAWSTPHLPGADTCVPPATLEAAWQEAVTLAPRISDTDAMAEEITRVLMSAHADGTLPFFEPNGCPQPVIDPVTISIIIGLAALAITLIVWAIAVAGST
jgi:hypothetical protein